MATRNFFSLHFEQETQYVAIKPEGNNIERLAQMFNPKGIGFMGQGEVILPENPTGQFVTLQLFRAVNNDFTTEIVVAAVDLETAAPQLTDSLQAIDNVGMVMVETDE